MLSRMIGCRTDGVPGAIDQMVVAEYFRTEFDAHIRKLTATLREKHDVLVEALPHPDDERAEDHREERE